MANKMKSVHDKSRMAMGVMLFSAWIAPVAFAHPAWAACPCNVDPVTICTSGDCSELPAFNYEEMLQALQDYAATEGALGDGLISCGGNFSDITAVAGIRRGSYPGSLLVRAELDQCLAVQTYDDANGVMQTNYYVVEGLSASVAAECLASVHRVCEKAERP